MTRRLVRLPLARTISTHVEAALVKPLAQVFRYQQLSEEGRYRSISEMARAERIERGYLGPLLRLMLLAPVIVEAILDGRQMWEYGLPELLQSFPAVWQDQRAMVGDVG